MIKNESSIELLSFFVGSVRELREIREIRELWYTTTVMPAILSEASAEDTHPPPRRGLGGGSGLQLLSLRKAGVERMIRAMTIILPY